MAVRITNVQKMFMNCTGNNLLDVKHDGFDKPITLGSDKISGNIEIEADRCCAEFYDIKITDITTDNVKHMTIYHSTTVAKPL